VQIFRAMTNFCVLHFTISTLKINFITEAGFYNLINELLDLLLITLTSSLFLFIQRGNILFYKLAGGRPYIFDNG